MPPLAFELITGGLSNLTYRVTDADGPALGAAPAAARPRPGHRPRHGPRAPHHHRPRPDDRCRSPPSIGLCTDDAVNGAPFYVMEFVDGIVVRDTEAGASPLARRPAPRPAPSLVDVLAAIHEVDVDAVGLGDLGRREAYVERQLKRWYAPVGGHPRRRGARGRGPPRPARRRRCPPAGPGHDRPRRLPARQLHPRPPRARSPRCSTGSSAPSATPSPTSASCSSTGSRPATRSRRACPPPPPSRASRPGPSWSRATPTGPAATVGDIGYYVALGYWKLACILQGVLVRYRAGAMGDQGDDSGRLLRAGRRARRRRHGGPRRRARSLPCLSSTASTRPPSSSTPS